MKWKLKRIKVSELKEFGKNPRLLTKKGLLNLENSIKKFGIAEPLVVNTDLVICGGHGRLKILKRLNIDEVDCYVPDQELSKEDFEELNIRLNANIAGEWDMENLANQWDSSLLEEWGMDLKFDNSSLEGKTGDDDRPDDDKTPKRCKSGDIWELGSHKLMCGDSTKQEDVIKLMDSEKADMVFTDPPYGVSYGDKNKYLNAISRGNRIQDPIKGDHGTVEETGDLVYEAFCRIKEILNDYSSYYITAPQGGDLLMMMMMMMGKAGLTLRHTLIWRKNNHVLGRCDYNYKHEPILYGWTDKHKFYGKGDHKFSVWDIDKPIQNDLHPTMKPVELIVNAILNSTEKGMNVVDLFGGSGSALIACEKTNRKCYMMELDEHYCDVILNRWEDFTGQKAKKLS